MNKLIRNTLMLAALPLVVSAAFAAPARRKLLLLWLRLLPLPLTLSAEDKAATGKIYFERCAGCLPRHAAQGRYRQEPRAGQYLKLGNARLEKVLSYGTEGGMPNFDDILSKKSRISPSTCRCRLKRRPSMA